MWLAVVLVTGFALAVVLAFLWVRKAMLLGSGGVAVPEDAGLGVPTEEQRAAVKAMRVWRGPM